MMQAQIMLTCSQSLPVLKYSSYLLLLFMARFLSLIVYICGVNLTTSIYSLVTLTWPLPLPLQIWWTLFSLQLVSSLLS